MRGYTTIIGIALWALIPGFIAKKKGRSFWGYYFLSFLISPLITTIVTFCVSDQSDYLEKNSNRMTQCKSCGYLDKYHFKVCPQCGKRAKQYIYLDKESTTKEDRICFCRKCGEKLIENSQFCRKCGTEVVKEK